MAYPPEFSKSYKYPAVRDLENYDVFLEGDGKNPMFLTLSGLPDKISYGKHYGLFSLTNPKNIDYDLKNGTDLLFEVKDSAGNIIFCDTTDIITLNGSLIFYIWLKKDPLRIYDSIQDGKATLTVVGVLDGNGIPENWKDTYNYRCSFPLKIQKELPNISPVLFQLDYPSMSLSESIEKDFNDTQYKKSYIWISASNLQTYGGKVDSIEVSFRDDNSKSEEYNLLTTYPITSSDFEISAKSADGLNPVSDYQNFVLPRELRRYKNHTFKFRYLNSDGDYVKDILDNNKIVEVSASLAVTGSPVILDTADNLITGSGGIIFGTSENDGIEMSFSPAGKGSHKTTNDIEFTPIVNGRRLAKSYAIDDQGRFFNDIGSNTIEESRGGTADPLEKSPNSSIFAATGSHISGSADSFITGKDNVIYKTDESAIVGGRENTIHSTRTTGDGSVKGFACVIVGGEENTIRTNHPTFGGFSNSWNTIIGGELNKITGSSVSDATIANTVIGGTANLVSGSRYGLIAGGTSNVINTGTVNSSVISSVESRMAHDYSVILGMNKATSSADYTVYVQNLDVAGSLHVNEITSSLISASIIHTSGSSKFGDDTGDKHEFTGSVDLLNNLTVNGTLTSEGDTVLNGSIKAGDEIHGKHEMTGSFYLTGSMLVENYLGVGVSGDTNAVMKVLDISGKTTTGSWETAYSDLDIKERAITLESSNPTLRITAVGGARSPKIDLCRSNYTFNGSENFTDYRHIVVGGHYYFRNIRSGYFGGLAYNLLTVNANNNSILIGSGSSALAPDTMPTSSLAVLGDISSSGDMYGNFGNTNDNHSHYFVITSGSSNPNGPLKTAPLAAISINPDTDVSTFGEVTINDDTANGIQVGVTPPAGAFIKSQVSYHTNGGTPVSMDFLRSRGTQTSPITLIQNDYVGTQRYSGHDGSSYRLGAAIRGDVDGPISTNVMPIGMNFLTTANGSLNSRMFISSSGNVGIHTIKPTKTLTVAGDISSSGDFYFGGDEGVFKVDGTETLTLKNTTGESGSILVSGSMLLKNNSLKPSDSGSRLYNYDGNLYFHETPIGPTQYEMLKGAMNDDIGTSQIVLPFNNNFESTAHSDESGILCPVSGSLKTFSFRGELLSGDITYTLRAKTMKPGQTTSDTYTTIDTQTIDLVNANDNDPFTIVWDSDATVAPGDVLFFTIQGDVDRAGAENYYFNAVIAWDYSTLPKSDTIYT